MADTRFREGRWLRAGATPDQVEARRAAHADLTSDEQAAEAVRVDSVSDEDLAAELAAGDVDLADGTIEEVLGRVGDDPEKAAVALSHEQARPRPRSTLLERLTEIVGAGGDG